MSIFELQQERNKQLSQPKIKEAEQAYKPISETYNIVDYYNTMRNGKYEQMTQSKSKIPNQQLSYFSDHLKSSELMKTGKHNLNLYSLLSDRANQLKGYNKPQVYEEKISSGSDNAISNELEQLLNSFVDKIQSGVFDITMSNDVYKIFKIFETSSFLFTTELLEKYSEYVKDIISVFEEDSTRELIKRDFKGSNILQLLLILTEKIEEMISIMIEANQQGKNNIEKQIILKNYIKSKNLKKPDMKYIKIVNAEYKAIDRQIATAKKEKNQTLINALTIKMDDLKRVLPSSPTLAEIPISEFEDTAETASAFMPPISEISEPIESVSMDPESLSMPAEEVGIPDSEEVKITRRMEEENDRIQVELATVNERIQQLVDAMSANNEDILKLEEEKRNIEVDKVEFNRIPMDERSELESRQLRDLNTRVLAITKEIKQLKTQNDSMDIQNNALIEIRNSLYSRITSMESFIKEFTDVSSKTEKKVRKEKKEKKVKPKKVVNTDEFYIFNQSYADVKKPIDPEILKPIGNNIISKSPKYSYPRTQEKFLEKVKEKANMFSLLRNLNIDTGNVAMPRSDLLTVKAMYEHFLSANPNLMTSTGQPWFE